MSQWTIREKRFYLATQDWNNYDDCIDESRTYHWFGIWFWNFFIGIRYIQFHKVSTDTK